MDKLNSKILVAGAILLASLAVGCAKSNDNNGGNPAPLPAPPPATCGVNGQCPPLGAYGLGYYSESASFYNMQYAPQTQGLFQPNSNYARFLQEAMGVCNREKYVGGMAECQAWLNGYHDIVILMEGANANSVRLVVRAYPQSNSGFNYSYQLPSWDQFFLGLVGFPVQNQQGFFNPMILNATIFPVNQSQGLEIRAYGPQLSPGYNNLLQLQVAQGKLNDTSFSFRLFWSGQEVATGTMLRCQTQNCGL